LYQIDLQVVELSNLVTKEIERYEKFWCVENHHGMIRLYRGLCSPTPNQTIVRQKRCLSCNNIRTIYTTNSYALQICY